MSWGVGSRRAGSPRGLVAERAWGQAGLGTRMVSSCMGTCNGQQACRSLRGLVAERANVIKAINSN